MSRHASPSAIGAFVLGAIAIAAFALIALGGGRLFSDLYKASIFFDGSVNGLVVGSPVKIRGVPIGQVVAIRAIVDEGEAGHPVTRTETVVELDPSRFDQTSRVGVESVGEREPGDTDTDVRAQLNMQSLLTGQLYVALSIDPHTPGNTGPERLAQHPQIPSIPTTFEMIEARARDLLERIQRLPLEELVRDTNETIVAIGDVARDPALTAAVEELTLTLRETRTLIGSVDDRVGPISDQAIAALEEMETTLAAVEQTLQPGSPVVYQLGATLQEVSQAAQAMRALANSLERQPNALVFGKAGEAE